MLHHGSSLPWTIRAVQLDLARQMETVDFVRRYADFAAAQQYNTLVLYLEARVRTASFSYRAPDETYTLDEMATIVKHAHAAGMQVVPVVPSLGHADQFFAISELRHLAEEREGIPLRQGGSGCSTFCPSHEGTYDFLSRYYRELAEVFTDPCWHVGLDEAWNFGYCTQCRAFCRQHGMGPLFTRHLLRMHDICQALGKRVWLWDDMYEFFPEEVSNVPRDVVMNHWVYDEVIDLEGARSHFANRWRHNWLAKYAREGIEAIVCPWTECPQSIEAITDYARRHQVLGGLLTQWAMTDRFHAEFTPLVAATGRMWAQSAYDPATAWREGCAAVLPDVPPDKADSLAALYAAGRVFPSSNLLSYLIGPLTESERLLRATTQSGFTLVSTLRQEHLAAPGRDILDELAVTTRCELLHWQLRELLPEIYNPRRPEADTARLTEKATACRQELDALLALRKPIHAALRPGMQPHDGAVQYIQRIHAALQPAWERLARQPSTDDWWVILRLFLPDYFGWPNLKVSARFAGDTEMTVLAYGGYKPGPMQPGSHFNQCIPFASSRRPERIRLEFKGYGGQGICYLEAQNAVSVLYPTAITHVAGQVEHPEAILRDDSRWCYLGRQQILPAVFEPAIAEERAVLEVTLGEQSA